MIKFEKVKRFEEIELDMPIRATKNAAGYDFVAAEDITIPSYWKMMKNLEKSVATKEPLILSDMASITKQTGIKPTLVSTGMKCELPSNLYLQLSVRSSCPLKYWLIMANSVGVIDADYYNNESNEGEIFFQLINLSPFDIEIKRGDKIGQGIILPYNKTNDDETKGKRIGGFGSTNK